MKGDDLVACGYVRQVSNVAAERVGILIVSGCWLLIGLDFRQSYFAVLVDVLIGAMLMVDWLRAIGRIKQTITVEFHLVTPLRVENRKFKYSSFGMQPPNMRLRGPTGLPALELMSSPVPNSWQMRMPRQLLEPQIIEDHLRRAFDPTSRGHQRRAALKSGSEVR